MQIGLSYYPQFFKKRNSANISYLSPFSFCWFSAAAMATPGLPAINDLSMRRAVWSGATRQAWWRAVSPRESLAWGSERRAKRSGEIKTGIVAIKGKSEPFHRVHSKANTSRLDLFRTLGETTGTPSQPTAL